MATLTIRMPDAKRDRLASMAAQRGNGLNKLIEELSVRVISEHDSEMRFRTHAARGDVDKALVRDGTYHSASAAHCSITNGEADRYPYSSVWPHGIHFISFGAS